MVNRNRDFCTFGPWFFTKNGVIIPKTHDFCVEKRMIFRIDSMWDRTDLGSSVVPVLDDSSLFQLFVWLYGQAVVVVFVVQ